MSYTYTRLYWIIPSTQSYQSLYHSVSQQIASNIQSKRTLSTGLGYCLCFLLTKQHRKLNEFVILQTDNDLYSHSSWCWLFPVKHKREEDSCGNVLYLHIINSIWMVAWWASSLSMDAINSTRLIIPHGIQGFHVGFGDALLLEIILKKIAFIQFNILQ